MSSFPPRQLELFPPLPPPVLPQSQPSFKFATPAESGTGQMGRSPRIHALVCLGRKNKTLRNGGCCPDPTTGMTCDSGPPP